MSDARRVIATLRRGDSPPPEDLAWFAAGLADGSVSDAQAGAFAMAICMGGLGPEGRAALTCAMRDSGRVLTWDLDAPVLDKHSTGGVGDCVSLVLAPALAACGVYVPMISGRGLGHTGGTLDKLEAIPGVTTSLDAGRFRRLVAEAGCAIVGASADIAPADRRLYAVRDVTATVDSLDLITASILSKKLAAGLDGLVLDVKVGSGAFMKDDARARALAEALVATACRAGCPTTALITGMDEPAAPALGNALEVAAAMAVLTGAATGPLHDLATALGGELLASAGLAASAASGAERVRDAIAGGGAAERFGRMVYGMGGPRTFVEDWARFLPGAPVVREVSAPEAGHVTAIDGEALGLAVVALGGGRRVEGDRIDPAVGITDMVRLGAPVAAGAPLARVHAAREGAADAAARAVAAAVTIRPEPGPVPPLFRGRVVDEARP
ncbi:thymidine phosphorylase [Roseivivax isoporae]|uniref:Thymidine phosphorylase n=1 Tax=Roseivivax isoporae LMG 25204 TaxID=1449351 RepID=X7F3V4_9RHOB|nr:thymidine phosphorylase [Roseivivax isoporae]ETX27567.1 thymidine phosphorylase [Roseivivax isoporae LMG 25204]